MSLVQNPILSTSSFCMACIHVQLYKKNSGGGGGGHGGVCVWGGGGKRGAKPTFMHFNYSILLFFTFYEMFRLIQK